MAVGALVWSLVLITARGLSGRGRVADFRAATGPSSAAPPPSLEPAAPALEDLGRFPATHVVYDPRVPGLAHAGGEVTYDGGRSWQALTGDDGRRIVPLGAARALAPALGPAGRVLYGEVLFDEPAVARGLGALAHGAEWRDGRWHALLPVNLDDRYAPEEPRWRAVAVAYKRGQPLLATDEGLLLPESFALQVPVRVKALLAASDGAVWLATEDLGRFPLYVDPRGTGAWQPVPGAPAVAALAEGGGGVAAAGERFGRRTPDGAWHWTASPVGRLEGIAAHPRLPLVAAWGARGLMLSRDAHAEPQAVRLGGVKLAWAAWDPTRDDAVTLVDRRAFARRLVVPSHP
jgi:hypothetical protein